MFIRVTPVTGSTDARMELINTDHIVGLREGKAGTYTLFTSVPGLTVHCKDVPTMELLALDPHRA